MPRLCIIGGKKGDQLNRSLILHKLVITSKKCYQLAQGWLSAIKPSELSHVTFDVCVDIKM